MIICPSCNMQNQPGAAFCDNCGHDLRNLSPAAGGAAPTPMPPASGGAVCAQCGYNNIPGASFCENCGAPLSQAAPAPIPPAPQPIPQPVPQAPPPQPAPAGGGNCPSCGTPNAPGAAFCENCGMSLAQAAPPPQAAPAGGATCPNCGKPNLPGAGFCEDCGMQLGQPAAQPALPPYQPPARQAPPYQPPVQPAMIRGRLVIQASNASLPFPTGKTEAFVGREDPVSGIFPEVDLDPHGGHDGGVGRKHARFFMQGAQLMLEDLNSVNGTLLNKQKLAPNQPQAVMDGAEIRFGRVVTVYHAQ